MRNIKLLIVILISLLVFDVRADISLPSIIKHDVMVTNKNGTICYEDGKETDKTIPYGTILEVNYDINRSYINVVNDEYNCYVKYVDVSSKTQNFDLNNKEVIKIKPLRAIVLANGGLNMRKGPSVTYSKIVTIPQYTVVTLTHSAGDYWYYTEYGGKSGWITSMNMYIGFDNSNVLINYEKTNIYDEKAEKIIGTIPANTEITDYVDVNYKSDTLVLGYYVIYNEIKGYLLKNNLYKMIDFPGKIKLTKDYVIYDNNGNPTKKIIANQELEYTMVGDNHPEGLTRLYIPNKKIELVLLDDFEYIEKAKISVKKSGYIGEGLFGETKEENAIPFNKDNIVEENRINNTVTNKKSMSLRDIIIICLLAGIFLSFIAIVIIKLVNNKKTLVVKPIENPKEIDAAREVIARRMNSQQNKTRDNDEEV